MVGGFLLTSIPSWASVAPIAGKPLAALVLLWLTGGRVLFWSSVLIPGWLVAIVNLAFPLVLLLWAAPPALLSEAGRRHLSIGMALVGYVLVQGGLFYAAWLWPDVTGTVTPVRVLDTTVNLLLVLIALTATRIVRVVAMEHERTSAFRALVD